MPDLSLLEGKVQQLRRDIMSLGEGPDEEAARLQDEVAVLHAVHDLTETLKVGIMELYFSQGPPDVLSELAAMFGQLVRREWDRCHILQAAYTTTRDIIQRRIAESNVIVID
eukprot:EG_transcript_11837